MARKSSTVDAVKKLPASENGVCIIVTDATGATYKISRNKKTNRFTLWEIVEGGFLQKATGGTTYELYELLDFNVDLEE